MTGLSFFLEDSSPSASASSVNPIPTAPCPASPCTTRKPLRLQMGDTTTCPPPRTTTSAADRCVEGSSHRDMSRSAAEHETNRDWRTVWRKQQW